MDDRMQTLSRWIRMISRLSTSAALRAVAKRVSPGRRAGVSIRIVSSLKRQLADLSELDLGVSAARAASAALKYTRELGVGKGGKFLYTKRSPMPILYASTYAALFRHLTGDIDALTEDERRDWCDYINGFQCPDGLYRDPVLQCEIAETEDWWGWRHLSAHVVGALTTLGGKPRYPFAFLNPLYEPGQASRWIAALPWAEKPDYVSNTVMNYGVLLQYERDFNSNPAAASALAEIFAHLDGTQNPTTGLWNNRLLRTPGGLSVAVQSAYHLWNLYFYELRPLRHIERAIDSCLATQNRLGGYGVALNSSACEDVDSIDPLCRFYYLTDHRRDDIRHSLERALRWVLVNQLHDGGFVFRRFERFAYGHELMTTSPEQSHLFGTWFRTLSIAYLGQVLNLSELPADTWRWVKCPGYQFWHGKGLG